MGHFKPAAVVAAAGRSRRMGTPKQLLDWDGRPAIAARAAAATARKRCPTTQTTGSQPACVKCATTAAIAGRPPRVPRADGPC